MLCVQTVKQVTHVPLCLGLMFVHWKRNVSFNMSKDSNFTAAYTILNYSSFRRQFCPANPPPPMLVSFSWPLPKDHSQASTCVLVISSLIRHVLWILLHKETSWILLVRCRRAGYFNHSWLQKTNQAFWWCGTGPNKQQVTFSLSFSLINWFIY